MKESERLLGIAAVEREVGLSKEVLRVWERRYGFPVPLRGRNDERGYPADQVERLRLVKRLMDQGHRPGRLLARPLQELQELAAVPAPRAPAEPPAGVDPGAADAFLACLRSDGAHGLARLLQQQLALQGLARFVQDTVGPWSVLVGDAWARGGLEVFEEHLFTETAARTLRQAISGVPQGQGPTVLLTTVPGEPHGLGLLMVEAILVLHGARCINLGTGVPVADIARAAQAYGAHVVALSFSSAFAPRRVPAVLRQLRVALDAQVELWAGGSAVRRLAAVQGVRLLPQLDEAVQALDAWRAGHAAGTA